MNIEDYFTGKPLVAYGIRLLSCILSCRARLRAKSLVSLLYYVQYGYYGIFQYLLASVLLHCMLATIFKVLFLSVSSSFMMQQQPRNFPYIGLWELQLFLTISNRMPSLDASLPICHPLAQILLYFLLNELALLMPP